VDKGLRSFTGFLYRGEGGEVILFILSIFGFFYLKGEEHILISAKFNAESVGREKK